MKTFICTICGYVFTGKEPPEFCPQCKAPASKFQEQAAEQMQVARTTVQALYAAARQKLARAVCLGQELHIEGGRVQLCQTRCKNGCCHLAEKTRRCDASD